MKDFFQKNIGLVLSVLGVIATLIVILQFLIAPMNVKFEVVGQRLTHIENQVNNHIPTQIRELRNDVQAQNKELRNEMQVQNKELRNDIKAINQRLDQTNQRFDRLFERLTD